MAGSPHEHPHAFSDWLPREREGLVVASRRNFLKLGMAGLAGLSLPDLLRSRARASESGQPIKGRKAVILLWMAGGPSHIDTLDPKPDRPLENRGPFGVIPTRLPGVIVCEHLPLLADRLDRFTILRSIDATGSNHEPNRVFQTGFKAAAPRVNPAGKNYPAIGSSIAKFRGANTPGVPPYVAFRTGLTHIADAGHLGRKYDPFIANDATKLPIYSNVGEDTGRKTTGGFFQLPDGLSHDRLYDRRGLLTDLDTLRREIDHDPRLSALDDFHRQAVDLLVGPQARAAFDLEREPPALRDRYGPHLWCQQALLARRLVEAGVAFVTIDLSYHPASGTWDTHGDNIPPYGGISKGLKPLLPLFDHLVTTLVDDLTERGLIDDVLVIAMGEFGRTPEIGTQGSTDGRNHWNAINSALLAGGGLRHGQVVGASEADGGHIKSRPITPADLAATIYRHMGVPLDTFYTDPLDRPLPLVEHGAPLAELF
jgi:hypothetical protein